MSQARNVNTYLSSFDFENSLDKSGSNSSRRPDKSGTLLQVAINFLLLQARERGLNPLDYSKVGEGGDF